MQSSPPIFLVRPLIFVKSIIRRPTCILMGRRRPGITQEALDWRIQDVTSSWSAWCNRLNVSVASALILYEAQRPAPEYRDVLPKTSMLPERTAWRLLFEGGYPVLARVAKRKRAPLPPSAGRVRSKPILRVVGYHAGGEVIMQGLAGRCAAQFLTKISGAAQSNKLAKIGLHTVQDLLLHLPLRYEDRTQLYQIGELAAGVCLAIRRSPQLQHYFRRPPVVTCR